MRWEEPTFEELDMDAEARGYPGWDADTEPPRRSAPIEAEAAPSPGDADDRR